MPYRRSSDRHTTQGLLAAGGAVATLAARTHFSSISFFFRFFNRLISSACCAISASLRFFLASLCRFRLREAPQWQPGVSALTGHTDSALAETAHTGSEAMAGGCRHLGCQINVGLTVRGWCGYIMRTSCTALFVSARAAAVWLRSNIHTWSIRTCTCVHTHTHLSSSFRTVPSITRGWLTILAVPGSSKLQH